MCADLKKMNSTLLGETKLEDNDSDAFVKFEVEPNEKLNISG